MDYTKEEKDIINEAWFQLTRIVESDYDAEKCLENYYKFESNYRRGNEINAKILILLEKYIIITRFLSTKYFFTQKVLQVVS